jgi:cytochrome c peroxidase
MTPEDQAHVTAVMVNFGKALHAYQRKLISRNAPFDRYVAGDYQAISESAKRGLGLFIGKAACVECHSGPVLADGEFHNTGMEPMGEYAVPPDTAPDAWPLGGRYSAIPFVLGYEFNTSSVHSDDPATGRLDDLVAGDAEKGQWRTKSLRQVAETAPYMRTGQMATLREVVEFYSEGGHEGGFIGVKDEAMKPLDLTEQEIDDLVAFMETLTGEELLPALLQDTSLPGN